MILTEIEIKEIIKTYVTQYLTEISGGSGARSATTDKKRADDSEIEHKEGEDSRVKEIRSILRTRGLNMAMVARELIRTIWAGMTLDSARSKLSKISRGKLTPTDEEINHIKRIIVKIRGNMA
jgi:hypothetical protein